ncbi:aspartate aminotransferase family protein [Tumebacillus sp. ITR2]|uniref:Aspartate aminotransferase family protein n=1 Tax=Tumebacillus amylolyticus TaxID=2801339 RepID=A0ABS1JG72_9BACL|nr:aspartate aminotransferase family protein [Tumebacillus amylolyticus]MBL0389287.1 aspartate aminotransferase family protein [Tumebacillus amylolyticus]
MVQTSMLIKPNLNAQYPVVDYGQGVYLYDQQGTQYLDGCSGAIVANLGHGLKQIADAAYEQALKVSFTYRTQFTSPAAETLAQRLVEKSPGMDWVFFVNSGSEATEVALRLAWQYWQERGKPEKRKVLSRRVSYHGMTLGALGVSGHYGRRHRYNWLLHEEPAVAEAYCYRCPFALEPESCGLKCADDLERKIRQAGADQVAAFIAEPIVGASGAALTPPAGYFEKIREICDRYDVLLIADEVMTGLGRTGEWFGMDHWNVKPDLIAVGKGMSAGYSPIAAIMASERVMETIRAGSGVGVFGHTYSGNPQSCAISLAVLDYVEENGLVEQVRETGQRMEAMLRQLASVHGIVGDVRGKGLLFGMELVADRAKKSCFDSKLQVANRLVSTAMQNGLVIYPSQGMVDLYAGDAILVAPPFVINEQELQEMTERLDKSLKQVAQGLESEIGKGMFACN